MSSDSLNKFTLYGEKVDSIPIHKLFISDGYSFDVSELYHMIINNKFKNPYNGEDIFLNERIWEKFFNHDGLTSIQRNTLRDKFNVNMKDKNINDFLINKIERNSLVSILYQISTSGLIMYNDYSEYYLNSERQLQLLRGIILNNKIGELKSIHIFKNKPYYGKKLVDIISNIDDTCIHDIGHSLLKFYVFYYILLNGRNFKDWIVIRNAILSEWNENETFSMKIGEKYGISNGSFKTNF